MASAKRADPGVNIWRKLMKTTLARRAAALYSHVPDWGSLPRFAQEKTVRSVC